MQTIFQCTNCPITYHKKKTKRKRHERKHRRQQRKERIYKLLSNHSKVWNSIFYTITELREHKKLHITSMCCRMGCGINFNASLGREFHESVCNERLSTNDLEQLEVRTRSRIYHRLCWSSDESGDSNSWKTSVKNKRKRKVVILEVWIRVFQIVSE